MAWALIWNVILSSITLILAAAVTLKAPTNFEALLFLMALIAYHRLLWFIDSGHEDNRQRILLILGWFHRLDNLIKNEELQNDEIRTWLAGLQSEGELISAKDLIETYAKRRSNVYWIHAVTEVVLMVAVVWLLLQ